MAVSPVTSPASDARAERRLALLSLADRLGNVAEACRRLGFSRPQYYAYRKRYEHSGPDGLRDRPPVARSHPKKLPAALVEGILRLALEQPAAGSSQLASLMAAKGVAISGAGIQKQLNLAGLGKRRLRWQALEQMVFSGGLAPSEAQIAFIEKCNPSFRERARTPRQPGDLLCQDVTAVDQSGHMGRLHLHYAVDTASLYVFAQLHVTKGTEAAISLLHSEVLPFYEGRGSGPQRIWTDRSPVFSGRADHPYEVYLRLYGITHAMKDVGASANGHAEHVRRILLDEYLLAAIRRGLSFPDLSAGLGQWLRRYNEDLPRAGFPTQGRTPSAAMLTGAGLEVSSEVVDKSGA